MIRCDICGWVGNREDKLKVKQDGGEYQGIPVTFETNCCPNCHGEDFTDLDLIDDEDDM